MSELITLADKEGLVIAESDNNPDKMAFIKSDTWVDLAEYQ